MARRKLSQRNIRKIQRSAGSYYVRLPIELIRKFGWKEGQKVVVDEYGKDKFIIKDWKK